jgi:exopolysaccharide biosynthesis polyprenyl glycosylphosphotransferase
VAVADVSPGADVVDLPPIQERLYERPAVHPIQRRRWRVLILATVLVDLLALAVAAIVATISVNALALPSPTGGWLVISLASSLTGLALVGLYDMRRIENPVEELRRILYGVTLGGAIMIVISRSESTCNCRGFTLVQWTCALIAVIAGRRVVRKLVHALRRRGRLRRRALIVGADLSGRTLARHVTAVPWEGLDVIGFVSTSVDETPDVPDDVRLIGRAEDLRELVVSLAISDVLVAPSVAGDGGLESIVSGLDGVPVDLRIAPGLDGFLTSRVSIQPLGQHALLAVERAELQPLPRFVKRLMDLIVGGILLLLSAPFLAIACLAVRIESPGPAFFGQSRVGLRGRRFRMWKLRTMREGAEEERALLESRNEAGELLFKMREDPRVTRVGRLLRRMSIDELPQLLNVVLGHMSLVGPRPPLPDEVDRYDDRLGRRLLVRPGLTGLWQVSGRNELSFEDYVRYDLLYVQNWSIALDFYILAKTVPAVLSGRGAY